LARPVVLLVDPEVELPRELRTLRTVSTRINNNKLLPPVVTAILEDLSSAPVAPTRAPKSLKAVDVAEAQAALQALAAAYSDSSERNEYARSVKQLEAALANVLRKAGASVVTSEEADDQGADLALWIEELQTTVGNPILLELKVGDLDAQRLASAENGLRSWLLQSRSFLGLLVYWDASGRRFSKTMGVFPLVHLMSADELLSSLRDGKLATELASVRNKAVHGI
jgi:hypothetical protein